MMQQLFPYPAIDQPLSRLHTYDGLMINARRWQVAHDYHQRRQAIHYQSINQPGIVYGLGVKKLETPPAGVPAQFRDQRWLEIQPGLAIDVAGNPIIVNERIAFRLETEAPETGTRVVYIVLSYVEPKHLNRQHHSDTSEDQYRIDEKVVYLPDTPPPDVADPSFANSHLAIDPLGDRHIELCRLWLAADEVAVSNPVDVLHPCINEIDLRHRYQAQPRPQAVVRVAQVQPTLEGGDRHRRCLSYLMRSLAVLYPPLQGLEQIDTLILPSPAAESPYDAIYLSGADLQALHPHQFAALREQLQGGATLLIELEDGDEVASIPTIRSLEASLSVYLEKVEPRGAIQPCCTTPFLFDGLPVVGQQAIQLWLGEGVVVIVGNLSSAWGPHPPVPLPRHEIRAAQELGVNLLSLSQRRRQLIQLSAHPPARQSF